MATPNFSALLPNVTQNELKRLTEALGINRTQVVVRAIHQLYQQEIHTMTTDNIIQYGELDRKFGTVLFEGKVYWLAAIADFSNRVFNGGYQDAGEGEPYTTEFSCPAYDSHGDQYRVYWQFDTIKGGEPADLSDYPWDDEHILMVRPE